MLSTCKFKKWSFQMEWQTFEYQVNVNNGKVIFTTLDGEVVPAPPKDIIKRLKQLLPHYEWETTNKEKI